VLQGYVDRVCLIIELLLLQHLLASALVVKVLVDCPSHVADVLLQHVCLCLCTLEEGHMRTV
jgi:hypothetical protein